MRQNWDKLRKSWEDGMVNKKCYCTELGTRIQVPRACVKVRQVWQPPVIPALRRLTRPAGVAELWVPQDTLNQWVKWEATEENMRHQLQACTHMHTFALHTEQIPRGTYQITEWEVLTVKISFLLSISCRLGTKLSLNPVLFFSIILITKVDKLVCVSHMSKLTLPWVTPQTLGKMTEQHLPGAPEHDLRCRFWKGANTGRRKGAKWVPKVKASSRPCGQEKP